MPALVRPDAHKAAMMRARGIQSTRATATDSIFLRRHYCGVVAQPYPECQTPVLNNGCAQQRRRRERNDAPEGTKLLHSIASHASSQGKGLRVGLCVCGVCASWCSMCTPSHERAPACNFARIRGPKHCSRQIANMSALPFAGGGRFSLMAIRHNNNNNANGRCDGGISYKATVAWTLGLLLIFACCFCSAWSFLSNVSSIYRSGKPQRNASASTLMRAKSSWWLSALLLAARSTGANVLDLSVHCHGILDWYVRRRTTYLCACMPSAPFNSMLTHLPVVL